MDRLAMRIKESSDPYLLQHAQSLAAARTGQLRRARTLAREAFDAAEGRGLREIAAGLRIGRRGVGGVLGKSIGGQTARGHGAEYLERTRRHVCRWLRARARGRRHSSGSTGERSRAPVSTRHARQIHIRADIARARRTGAQPAGRGHRIVAGERTVRARGPCDRLQLLLWEPVSGLRPWSGVRRQRPASAGGRRVSEDPRPSGTDDGRPGRRARAIGEGEIAGARGECERPLERRTRTSCRCGKTPTWMCRFWRRRRRITRNSNSQLVAECFTRGHCWRPVERLPWCPLWPMLRVLRGHGSPALATNAS